MNKPIFIAHRGAFDPARRENSLAAFERAKETGRFAYVEIDVRRTRSDDDGQRIPIIAHDATTNRLYDLQRIPMYKRTHNGVEISSLTYTMLKADSLEISTLAEVLRVLDGHPVNIEVKDLSALPEILDVMHDFIKQTSSRWEVSHFVISSFDWEVLRKARQLLPGVRLALLYGVESLPRSPFKIYREVNADFIHMSRWLAPFLAPLCALAGIKDRYVYTVNSKFLVIFLTCFGVNGFTTNSISLPDKF